MIGTSIENAISKQKLLYKLLTMTSKEKEFTDREIKGLVEEGRIVMVLFEAVYDLTAFADGHPGGRDILAQSAGTDATDKFI